MSKELDRAFDDLGASVEAFCRGEPLTEEQIKRARREIWREQPLSHRVLITTIRWAQYIRHYLPRIILIIAVILCTLFAAVFLYASAGESRTARTATVR
jgi:hypothetical protein